MPLVLLFAIGVPAILYLTRDEASTPVVSVAVPEQALSGETAETHAIATASEPIVAAPVEIAKPLAAPIAAPVKSAPVVAELAQPPAVPSPSELPEQIRIYEEARDAGRRGEFSTAIASIDDLLRRFPSTPLRAEAELTRAELFARADRLDEAVRAVDAWSRTNRIVAGAASCCACSATCTGAKAIARARSTPTPGRLGSA